MPEVHHRGALGRTGRLVVRIGNRGFVTIAAIFTAITVMVGCASSDLTPDPSVTSTCNTIQRIYVHPSEIGDGRFASWVEFTLSDGNQPSPRFPTASVLIREVPSEVSGERAFSVEFAPGATSRMEFWRFDGTPNGSGLDWSDEASTIPPLEGATYTVSPDTPQITIVIAAYQDQFEGGERHTIPEILGTCDAEVPSEAVVLRRPS